MPYRYLITTKDYPPFVTHWFDAENNFNKDQGMKVYDLDEMKFTTDGETWLPILEDHL